MIAQEGFQNRDMKDILTQTARSLKKTVSPTLAFILSSAAEYFSKSRLFELFLQAHMFPSARQSWSPLLLHSQGSSIPWAVTVSHSSPCFMLETLLAASLARLIHCLDPISIARVALMRLSSSLRKATQGKQPVLIVVNGLGKALQPLSCSSAPSFPKRRRNFVLKLVKTEQGEMNTHTFSFATAPGVLGTFDPLGL